jgi:hypothetical protein
MKHLDYHALLTVRGLPRMTKRQYKRLIMWLKKTADNFERENDQAIYSNRFRARLMK